MTGAIAANFHEGSRSEYLAQYIFASFGTAIAVPHQEDGGIDLYCTITERVGQLAWPIAHYTVQVKSSMSPWRFNNSNAVKWLIQHPLPLFLTIIDKMKGRVCVYQTSPRFYLWSTPSLIPQQLELIPSFDTKGRALTWVSHNTYSLSAPILDFSLSDMLKTDFRNQAQAVLQFWIKIEQNNINRIHSKILSCTTPDHYETNTVNFKSWVTMGSSKAKAEELEQAIATLKQHIAWIGGQFYVHNDLEKAMMSYLLLRELTKDEVYFYDTRFLIDLNARLNRDDYLYAGIDEVRNFIKELLNKKDEQSS